MSKKKLVWFVPLVILGTAVFVFLGGEVVKLLWNAILPPLFGWREVSIWQALGLLVLCRILFGGFGAHGAGRPSWRRRMAERWDRMTPEERERFRHGLCGHRAEPEPSTGETPAGQ